MLSKEKVSARIAMTDEQKSKLIYEDVMSSATQVDRQARSNNPMSSLTVDIFDAAVKAWEVIRDQGYDTKKVHIAIVVSPQTYLMLALTGVALKQQRELGRDLEFGDKPNDETRNALIAVYADIAAAQERNGTGSSHMGWAGIEIFPDTRIPYMVVGVVTKVDGDYAEPQVFDAEKFAALQQSYAEVLKGDEDLAKIEKMDELATVSGQVGRA